MARRPKRSLIQELTHHRAIALGAHTICAALADLHPDVAEFVVARKMLDDACKLLNMRIAEEQAGTPLLAEVGQ